MESLENIFCVENLCRTCMNQGDELIPLFESYIEDINDKNLAEILEICTDLKVEKDDGLPSQICQNCFHQLNIAYNFKCQSLEIDSTLREIINEQKFQPEIEFLEAEDFDILAPHLETDTTEPNLEESRSKTNDVNTNFFCEKCGKKFSKKTFYNHKKINCSLTFECKTCKLEFLTRKELRVHCRGHKKLLKCDYCTKTFQSLPGLEYHSKRHEGIQNYSCPIENCTKKFAIQRALNKHISTHSTDSSYLCYKCGKSFNTSDVLLYHIKTHDGRKPHLCTYCGKTFRQMCHLKSHVWIHTGIKPYECEKCKKRFTRPHILRKHLRKVCNNNDVNDDC